jgi:hypothetical protein
MGFAMLRALEDGLRPDDLRMAGLTLFDRIAYSAEFLDRRVPLKVLVAPGGTLVGLAVRWIDVRGDVQSVTLIERDLRIVAAGISLAGSDQFDTASLTGVLEKLA